MPHLYRYIFLHIYFQDAKVVEGRRKMFQSYLRSVVDYLSENDPGLADNVSKAKLVVVVPFFR